MRTLISLVLFCFLTRCVSAQETNPKPAQTPNLFAPLVTAGRLIKENKSVAVAISSAATLRQKREMLDDRDVQRSLILFREWLTTARAFTPADPIDPENFPQMGVFPYARSMARILTVEQYVLLADGKLSQAIDSARDGLALANALHGDSLIGWLVSLAVERIAILPICRHLDQLALRDCLRLEQLSKDWLHSDDYLPRVLERERLSVLTNFDKNTNRKEGPAGTEDFVKEANGVSESGEMDSESERLTPEEYRNLLKAVHESINQRFRLLQKQLQTPYTEWPDNDNLAEPASLADQLSSTVIFSIWRVLEKYIEKKVIARLLAVHAAIGRYRWEYNKLPDSLAALNLGEVGTDPYSGESFLYKTTGHSNTLESIGPFLRDEKGTRLKSRGKPVTLLTDRS